MKAICLRQTMTTKYAMHELCEYRTFGWGYNLVSTRGLLPFLSNAHGSLCRRRGTALYLWGFHKDLIPELFGGRAVDFGRGGRGDNTN